MTNAFTHIKNSRWFYPILLIGSVLAVYFPILGNDFLYYWDDQWVGMNTGFGYKPFWFHLASMLLHAANALLVYICIFRLLELSRRIVVEPRKLVAFFTALIFAVHPFNVESVAWMSASKVLVYSFFYLLATYTFLNYCRFAHRHCEGESPKQSIPPLRTEEGSGVRNRLLRSARNDAKTKWYY